MDMNSLYHKTEKIKSRRNPKNDVGNHPENQRPTMPIPVAFSLPHPVNPHTKVVVPEFTPDYSTNWYKAFNDPAVPVPVTASTLPPPPDPDPITDGEADLYEARTPSVEDAPTDDQLQEIEEESQTSEMHYVVKKSSLTLGNKNDSPKTRSTWIPVTTDAVHVVVPDNPDSRFYNVVAEVAGDHIWLKVYNRVMEKQGYLTGLLKGKHPVVTQCDELGEVITNIYGVPKCFCSICVRPPEKIRTAESKRLDNNIRAKKRSIKIITANWPKRVLGRLAPALLTVTYAGSFTGYAQPDNYSMLVKDLYKFLLVLRHVAPGVKYIWVPELQEKREGKPIHFHILCFNLPWLTSSQLNQLKHAWPKGFDENCPQGGENITRLQTSPADEKKAMYYIAKYLTKSGAWVPPEHKLYGVSKNLELPRVVNDPALVRYALKICASRDYVGWENPSSKYDRWRNVYIRELKFEPKTDFFDTDKPSRGRQAESFTLSQLLASM